VIEVLENGMAGDAREKTIDGKVYAIKRGFLGKH
jgi:hypothetical protein